MKVRRSLRVAGWVMVTVGSLLVAFLVYQLVFTNVLGARSQKAAEPALEQRYATAEIEVADTIPVAPPTTTTRPEGTTTTTQVVEAVRYTEPTPDAGTPFGTIEIPSIGLDKVLFEGVDVATLKKGPGHMPWTPLPGQPGNAVISGHRTTYGAPFFDLDKLESGDQIIVTTALGKSVYEIRRTIIVAPTDVWVTDEMLGAWLTLTTCNPKYSARERLIVQAALVEGPNYLYVETERQRGMEGAS
ncbi:MAG: sortase [Acidimicrobiia bacterium]